MREFDDFAQELSVLRDSGRYRQLIPRRLQGTRLTGPDGNSLVNFGSNDYLGYATELADVSKVAVGSTASALVCGWSEIHEQLAAAIAEFESTESAILFPSGYAACSGTVATLARQGDLVLSDSLNHASLIDGCRLSGAKRIIYPHCDVDFVEQVLRENRDRHSRIWIVTESVFSMDGDVAPLDQLCDVTERYGAELIVDEAHATGVLGPTGSGACEAFGVRHRVAVRIGTLSKAIGAQGGFVAASKGVIDYLVNRCRPLIYSTSLSQWVAAAALKRVVEVRSDPTRRLQLAERISQFHELTGRPASQWLTPIIPIVIGDCTETVRRSDLIREAGFFVPAIRPPTVPEGTARLRVSLSAGHTAEEVANLCSVLTR